MSATAAANRRVPRIVEERPSRPEPAAAERSSTDLRADLAALDAEHEASAARLVELEAGRNAVLLTDDDARAEAHDAEMQRVRRAIERADLKRPGMVAAIDAAVAREEADAWARKQADARAAVAAVTARLDAEYAVPAATIAAFLADWQAAADLARAAKVDGPDSLLRNREPEMIEPEGEDVFLVYIDEQGRDTDRPYPAGSYGVRPDGSPDVPVRPQARRTRPRPARYSQGIHLGSLAGRANLPPARVGDPAPWQGVDLMLKADAPDATPHVRRLF